MGDLRALQLRKAVGHEAVEDGRRLDRIGMAELGAAAEDQALAVGRHAIIGQHAARIRKGAVLRADRRGEIGRQFFRGDDVGADRHHAALELRRHVARIAIGGDDHVARLDGAARRFDRPARAGFGELRSTGVLRGDRDAALLAEIQQSLEEQGRVQMAGAAHHHAAAVIVGADLLALALRRHDDRLRSARLRSACRPSSPCRRSGSCTRRRGNSRPGSSRSRSSRAR